MTRTQNPEATKTAKGIHIELPNGESYDLNGPTRRNAEAVTFSFFRAVDFPQRNYTEDWWVPVVNKTIAAAGKPYAGTAHRVVVVKL
jgi:hypothetical protein